MMQLPRVHTNKKQAAQYLLLWLPTVVLFAYLIFISNQWIAVFQQNWAVQTFWFAAGAATALFLFAFRLRFITLTAILLLLMALLKGAAQFLQPQEFDAFFFIVRANNHFTLFLVGWLAGYGFSRSRFFSILWSVLILCLMALIIADTTKPKTESIMLAIAPVLVYITYIIYTSELIRSMNEDQQRFGWFVGRRLLGFLLLIGLILASVFYGMEASFTTIEKEWEQGGKPKESNDRQSSLTRNDGLGTATNPTMGLQGFNNKANKDSLVFVAKLDHYFPDGVTPNPLYFVSDYYTLYDTLTQTFETDTLRPYNDLYSPDLTTLPLYFTAENSKVLDSSLGDLNRVVATAEVYKKTLSARHFTAPSTAFFVQPISVPEENKNLYKSAYRTKMLVSELNSAYFVYNPAGDESLAFFQEQRFEALRSIQNYDSTPPNFMQYYTKMPRGVNYDSIGMLANQIVVQAGATAPIDKILAIRDYFLATDSLGQPTYRYSDNPGVPGIPSANKLCYFLFQNKRGYCAYYAGATMFLLRSLGIPTRIATGFLTVDRSSKNPGWYWFYEDQAHAWVQAWFPGYGWLDFDTTVPSTDQQEAPQPDQTPPLTSQTAWLVTNGKVLSVDTINKKVRMLANQLLYWDNPYQLAPAQTFELDVAMARILKDTGQVSLSELQPDMDMVAVSFAVQFKDLPPEIDESWQSLIKRWPAPIPIDEIKIIAPEPESEISKIDQDKGAMPWQKIALTAGIGLLFLTMLYFLIPIATYTRYAWGAKKADNPQRKAYFGYMASMLYLHQLGYVRGSRTPQQFAMQKIDPHFKTQLGAFIALYQKIKYSRQPLSDKEAQLLNTHFPVFTQSVQKQISFKKRLKQFLKPGITIEFFTQPNMLGGTNYTV